MIDRIRQAEEHYEQGDKFDAAGETERAILEWKRATELNPNHFGAHYNLGISYADEGNLDAAIEKLEIAFAINPDDADVRRELVRVLIERGEDRMAHDVRMAAIADWNHSLEVDSENALVHFYLGQADAKDRDYGNAIRHFREVLKTNRFFTYAYMQLADAYLADDRPRDAIDILRQALNVFQAGLPHRIAMLGDVPQIEGLPLNKSVSTMARKLAQLELDYGDPDQAMAALENAQQSKENAKLWQEIAEEFQTRGDAESAEIASSRAFEAEQQESVEGGLPNAQAKLAVAEEHFARAELLYEQGHSEDAFEEYAEAIRLNPDHANAHHGLGVIYLEDEEYDLAEKEFREVLRIDPDHSDAHFGFGEIFDVREDWQNALREYRDALRIEPKDQDALENLIWDLLEMDDVTQAQMELERAELEPSVAAELWEELGKAYEERGARGSAIAAYQRALQANKNLKDARDGLRRLGAN